VRKGAREQRQGKRGRARLARSDDTVIDFDTILNGGGKKGDDGFASDARAWRKERDKRERLGGTRKRKLPRTPSGSSSPLSLDDFFAYMLKSDQFIFAPTGELWPGASVNVPVPRVPVLNADGEPIRDENGAPIMMAATTWLNKNKAVEQLTWAPGEPQTIRDRLITKGGWIDKKGAALFNQYIAPTIQLGDASKAGPWLDHVRLIYPNDADHIIRWFAQQTNSKRIGPSSATLIATPRSLRSKPSMRRCRPGSRATRLRA
jgi:hypothetical protein